MAACNSLTCMTMAGGERHTAMKRMMLGWLYLQAAELLKDDCDHTICPLLDAQSTRLVYAQDVQGVRAQYPAPSTLVPCTLVINTLHK